MYKERLLKYKESKKEDVGRAKPKAKKPKPYKVTAVFSFMQKETRVTVGRYASMEDAKKAVHSHKRKTSYYTDFKIEDLSTSNTYGC